MKERKQAYLLDRSKITRSIPPFEEATDTFVCLFCFKQFIVKPNEVGYSRVGYGVCSNPVCQESKRKLT